MNESKIVGRLLFPTYQEPAGSVGPGMRRLRQPSVGLFVRRGSGAVPHHDNGCEERIRNVSPSRSSVFQSTLCRDTDAAVAPSARSSNGDRSKRVSQQTLVVSVGTVNRDAQRNAAGVSQYRSFDPQLTAIGGIFPAFFPRPAATWLSRRPPTAIAKRCRVSDRTSAAPASRIAAKYPGVSTLGNSDEPYWGCQIVGGVPSTGSRCATDKEYHWRRRRFARGRPTFERRGYFGSKGSSCCQRFSGIQANLPCQSQCMYTSVQAKKRFDEKPFLTSFYARKQHPFTYFGIGPESVRSENATFSGEVP